MCWSGYVWPSYWYTAEEVQDKICTKQWHGSSLWRGFIWIQTGKIIAVVYERNLDHLLVVPSERGGV